MAKIINPIKAYLNSNYFIIVTYIITIICWTIKNQNLAMIYYLMMAFLIIIFDAKRIYLITLICAAIINHRETTFLSNKSIIITIAIIGLPTILVDLFRNKLKYRNDILYAMLLFLLSNILSLININKDTLTLGLVGVFQVAGFCLLFLYFFNKDKTDLQEYLGKNALALGIAIAIEFAIYIITYKGDVVGKDIELGWGVSNTIAMMLLLIMPITYSLYLNNQRNNFILFFVMIDILLIIMMLSKGAYIALAIIILPLLIVSYCYVKERKKLIIDWIFSVLILLLMVIFIFRFDILSIGIKEYLEKMHGRGWFNDQARIEIFKSGINLFKKYPLFGAGAYTGSYYLAKDAGPYLHYHNYLIQTLATLGILGLLSFGFYIFIIMKNCFKKNPYHLCTLFAIISMLIHGLVDNTWYNPFVMVMITIFVLGTVRSESSNN